MVDEGLIYLDSSALVKLAVPELETAALLEFVRAHPRRATSIVARVELLRALLRRGVDAGDRGVNVLADVTTLGLGSDLLERATRLLPATLRSLDAIHIATALELVPELTAFVTYDTRQAAAATALGLRVAAPT